MAAAPLLVRPAHCEGNLSQATLVQVLRGIFLGRLTGLLHFARAAERLSLRFVSGQVVSASSGAVPARLGQILVRIGLLVSDDLEIALSKARDADRALGPVLVEMGLVRREQVGEALRLQVREILLTALFWGSGSFRFAPDEGALGSLEEISLRLPTPQILFEVVGAMTDADAVRQALGDRERPVAAVKDPPVRIERVTLSPGDGYVVSRADGSLTASEIVALSPLPREVVERSLLGLVCTGIVQLLPRNTRPASARPYLTRPPAASSPETEPSPAGDDRPREIREFTRGLPSKNHYEVLGLQPGAEAEEIKGAYLRLVKRFHPDAVGDAGEQAGAVRAIFQRVCEAYTVLRCPESRTREEARFGVKPSASPPLSPRGDSAPPEPAFHAAEPERFAPFPQPEEAIRGAEECLGKGQAWEAAAILQEAIPHMGGPLRARARILMARALLKSPTGTRSAEAELQGLLQDVPNCVEACLALGTIYKDTGRSLRAVALYRRVLELHPGHRLAEAELKNLPVAESGPLSFFGRLRAATR